MLGRSGPTPDEWSVQARLGLYRVALGQGDYRRADSQLTTAITESRRIGDRGGEIDALIGFSNTRSATGGLEAALSVLDSLETLLPPGDGWEPWPPGGGEDSAPTGADRGGHLPQPGALRVRDDVVTSSPGSFFGLTGRLAIPTDGVYSG
jgi:hypothetical protein